MKGRQHSGLGIASFITSIITGIPVFLLFIVAGIMEPPPHRGMDEGSADAIMIRLLLMALLGGTLVALALGIVGLLKKEQRKLFATFGTVLSALSLAVMIVSIFSRLGLIETGNQAELAKVNAAQIGVLELSIAIDKFHLDTGRRPRELQELVEEPENVSNWKGPYVDQSTLIDPWDNPYQYRSLGHQHSYDIVSLGADGTAGGTGVDRDVTSANDH